MYDQSDIEELPFLPSDSIPIASCSRKWMVNTGGGAFILNHFQNSIILHLIQQDNTTDTMPTITGKQIGPIGYGLMGKTIIRSSALYCYRY